MDPERAQAIAHWVANKYFGGNFARMAEGVGIDKGSISKWANAKGGITHRSLRQIANALQIPEQELLKSPPQNAAERGMLLQTTMGRASDLPSFYPPEMIQAIDWHLDQGEDLRAVHIAAAKVWDRVAPDDHLEWLDYAERLQRYLSRLRVR